MNNKIIVSTKVDIEVESILQEIVTKYSSDLVALLISSAVKNSHEPRFLASVIIYELGKIK